MHTTVPVVDARLPERIPVVGVETREPERGYGFDANVTAWQPFSAMRRTSAAVSLGIPHHRQRSAG